MKNFEKKVKYLNTLFIYKFRVYDYENNKLKIYYISPDKSHIYLQIDFTSIDGEYLCEVGELYFDNNTLVSKLITGKLFSYPMTMSIKTASKNNFTQTIFKIDSQILLEDLKKYFEVVEQREFEEAHKTGKNVSINDKKFSLFECEYVIENCNTGEFVLISICDVISNAMYTLQNHPLCKTILLSQYKPSYLKKEIKELVSIYLPSDLSNIVMNYYLNLVK